MGYSTKSKFNIGILIALALALINHYFNLVPQIDRLMLIFLGIIATLPVIYRAFRALRNKKITIDLLAVIALSVSLIKGEWTSVVFINLMITSARIFADYTENRAKNAIKSLLKLRPLKVKIKKGDSFEILPAESVKVGDLVIIETGDRVPVDGIIIEGAAGLDQSSLTGESIPVTKTVGEKVFSSTLNVSGSLVIKTLKVGSDTQFEKIIKLVEESQNQKAGIQTIADKFSSWYVLITLVGSILIYLFTKNLTIVLSVLLVTCADDIAVAIPMAFWEAIGKAAQRGIVIKGGSYLEGLAKIKTLIVDKTGTLTKGKISAEKIVAFGKVSEEKVLKLAVIAESVSEHPIAKAIVNLANEKKVDFKTPKDFEEYPGKGITAGKKPEIIITGSLRFLKELKVPVADNETTEIIEYETKGYTVVCVGFENKLIGFIALADELRTDVKPTLEALRGAGIDKIVMLTGDNERVALKVAGELGISNFHANLLPEDKLKFMREYLGKNGKVAMVGDGVNDAASLALADVGIAMGTIGSDAAIESADVALMQDDFSKVAEGVALGKFATVIAKEDFIIWGILNTFGLLLVFTKVIGPQGAALYNFVTDFFPLINSFRVYSYQFSPSLRALRGALKKAYI